MAVFAACRLPPSRRFRVELVSLPVDLGFAIVLLVKSTLLNNTRLDCHGLLQEKCKPLPHDSDAIPTHLGTYLLIHVTRR